MANILTKSIGKKLIMSISGLFLILFLVLHVGINALSLISPEAYQAGCDFMALPIVTVMVPILAGGFIIHILYGIILSINNLKARGKTRYAVPNKAAATSWSSKNMLVLGIIIICFIVLHLQHFWANMQLKDFQGLEPDNPNMLLANTFGRYWVTGLYLVWFAALWFHLTHGIWSALQTIGLNNKTWMKPLHIISYLFATLICGLFALVAVTACLRTNGII